MGASCLLLRLILPLCVSIVTYVFVRAPAPEGAADVIFTNATIYTGDAGLLWAEAMAVRKGRVIEIGPSSDVQAMAGPETHYVDLLGRSVVPGFIDSHLHLIFGGLQMSQIDLQDTYSHSEFIKKVQSFVQGVKSEQWVLGGGWNNEKWGGELPHVSWIDSFTKDVPVWLYRIDGHMGLANSKALHLAGITGNIPDPDGGSFIRAKDGGLTGILVDSAMKLVIDCIPEATVQERRVALTRASKQALSEGVTAIVDFGRFLPGSPTKKVWDDFHDVYRWADQTGNLLLRVSIFFPLETWSDVDDLLKQTGRKLSQHLRIGGVKAFVDGSLGSSTALFNEPYDDDPSSTGFEVSNQASILKEVLEADKRELQVAVHAIGDAANDKVLSIYQTVNSTNGQRDRRSRIEHAQHLSQNAPELFNSMGIIASMQPQHLLDDASFASRKLGEERALKQSYLFKSLLAKGTTLAFGSDWPVARLNPLEGMQAAIKRTPAGWKAPWIPSECIDIEAALQGYTRSAAYASFMDDDIGSLSRGKFADFAVLSGDIFENDVGVSVSATYKGGLKLFSRDDEGPRI